MTAQETGKILSIISEIYPSFRKDRNIQTTQDVWLTIFEHTPYAAVEQALMAYIATDTKGFPPVPGAINERIMQARELEGLTENDAWILVLKAVSRGIYNSGEEFAKLPAEVQRIVGHPAQLHEWALLDAGEVNTVIASAFRRSWRARKELEKALGVAAVPLLEEGKRVKRGLAFWIKAQYNCACERKRLIV